MKCLVHDENLDAVWKEVADSIGRQHIDEESNKKKKMRHSASTAISTPSVVIEHPPIVEQLSTEDKPSVIDND